MGLQFVIVVFHDHTHFLNVSDGDRLKENLKCLSRCQIIVDINTRDLTQHQVLDLTGSMKVRANKKGNFILYKAKAYR